MTRRSGLTLTEVLVTLAILAFGVLGILTLFPLAASQMAIAVREDRSAQAANAADGYMRAYWKTEFVEKAGANEASIMAAFDTPGGVAPANPDEPSYPVVIDPMGYVARSGPSKTLMGDGGTTKVARCTLSYLTAPPGPEVADAPPYRRAFRLCSLMDGMGYDDNGHPQTNPPFPTPGVADRELRYNWMWVLQRPQNGNKSTATMNVVVFDNRPHLYAPTGVNGAEGVFATSGGVVPGSTSLMLNGGPNVKPGMWIMDVTVTDPSSGTKIRHANFYQVVSMTPGTGYVSLELQTPLKKSNDPNVPGTYNGSFLVLKGVTNVYPRQTLTAD